MAVTLGIPAVTVAVALTIRASESDISSSKSLPQLPDIYAGLRQSC